ncbi:MAG: hypothetical protein GF355_05195 [Candidatus Eisenbacteria bacterium]|nr:hypothetical protein [Candidatus Eisenbacteria bacterium]
MSSRRPDGRRWRPARSLAEMILLGAAAAAGAWLLQTVRSDPLPLDPPAGAWTLESRARWVSPARAKELYNGSDVVFADVRDRESFMEGHVPGALNLPAESFFELYDAFVPWTRNMAIVVYGRAGDPADLDRVLMELEDLGHGELYALVAGIEGWKQAGGPVLAGGDGLLESEWGENW